MLYGPSAQGFSSGFAQQLQKASTGLAKSIRSSFHLSICPSFCPHGSAQLPPDR